MTRVGVIGTGVIFAQYRETLAGHPTAPIVAVADLDAERAREAALAIPGARALTPAQLSADPEVDLVLNLTIPAAHAEVALAAIAAGKDVYGEKPLAATFAEAAHMSDAAEQAGRSLGCAPDTVLGTAVQSARAAIEAGEIGVPVSATATWLSPGHEHWHPHPDFYYRAGGGPLLDMGPYYLTSLVHLLGPVAWVQGASSRARTSRTIGGGPRAGQMIPVEIDTHVTGILGHASGALSTVTFSFDAVATTASPIEVHGQEGVLTVPDPNAFAGPVTRRTRGDDVWQALPVTAGYEDGARGVGLVDFANGHRRASADIALHVLEIMTGLLDSAGSPGGRVSLGTAPILPSIVPFTPVAHWRGKDAHS